jgi:hypothetical protein
VLTKAKSLATQDFALGKAAGLTVDGDSHSYAVACNSPGGCIGATNKRKLQGTQWLLPQRSKFPNNASRAWLSLSQQGTCLMCTCTFGALPGIEECNSASDDSDLGLHHSN